MKFKNEWDPRPAGVIMLYFLAPVTILLLVVGIFTHDLFIGCMALILGAWCIWEAADAAYHAGMRREAQSRELR